MDGDDATLIHNAVQKVLEAFLFFDRDGDGYIEKKEVTQIIDEVRTVAVVVSLSSDKTTIDSPLAPLPTSFYFLFTKFFSRPSQKKRLPDSRHAFLLCVCVCVCVCVYSLSRG